MEQEQLSSDEPETLRRAWEAPTIEELDFGSTEASSFVPGGIDFGIYTA